MDRRAIFFVLYVFLLTVTTPALCFKQQFEKERFAKDEQADEAKVPQRRQLQLAAYAGLAVAPEIYAALLAAYGIYKLTEYGITKLSSDPHSHSCANNRGWCRYICQSHEYVDTYHSDVCSGGYDCCRPR